MNVKSAIVMGGCTKLMRSIQDVHEINEYFLMYDKEGLRIVNHEFIHEHSLESMELLHLIGLLRKHDLKS